ncbi:MAG: hypoxanthine phosphoribosyltransferase [Bacteroidetes bacterium]|nr:MAG: hypoxanthine phosphoribosyltransferase [Bacteroidota bacterium]
MTRVGDKQFEVFITAEELQKEITSLAAHINKEYAGKEVVFIAVLNGAFMFASDLMKNISLDCRISFVKMSSYKGLRSTGTVEELIGLGLDLKGKEVILVEDIVDTGLTIDKIIGLVSEQEPASVKVCTLLYKPTAFKGSKEPDYVGFSIPDAFVVGYGLDYMELGRNLNAIYQIKS